MLDFPRVNGAITYDTVPINGGGYSNIYKGTWITPEGDQRPIVLKRAHVRPNGRNPRRNARELYVTRNQRLAKELGRNPHIIEFLGFYDPLLVSGPFPDLVYPYCQHGDVMQYIESHPKVNRLEIIREVAKGIAFIHKRNVIHGDIKPLNIVIDDWKRPLIADFDRSRVEGVKGFTTKFISTPLYEPPEYLKEDNLEDIQTTKPGDIFSLSMTMLEIKSGLRPFFHSNNPAAVAIKVSNGERPDRDKYPATFSDSLWELLRDCWAHNPVDRPGVEDVVKRLESELAMVLVQHCKAMQ